jgi:PAS domain S-box-containing protein
MAMARSPTVAPLDPASVRSQLVEALQSCTTEADIVQVLYASLHPALGYQGITLYVLEREGWYHSLAMDSGVLQDVRRRMLKESVFGPLYARGETRVLHPAPTHGLMRSRGPGASKTPRTVIWVPVKHRDAAVGAVVYQSSHRRSVEPEELAYLEEIHRHLGVLVANAYLNETTRNQAVRLSALNAIARALSSTLDESGVVAALYTTLSQLLPVDVLELVAAQEDVEDKVRVLRYSSGSGSYSALLPVRSRQVATARMVLQTGEPYLRTEPDRSLEHQSAVWVPIKEGGQVRGSLSIRAQPPEAYEESTVTFLEQVADEVALAVRNAWSYAAIEAQRRRLEVVNAVGRRLASSLDRWSIMRTLREELSRHLEFDQFALVAVREGGDGPIAEGYLYDSGVEQPVPAVVLTGTGPSREAYETKQPVLVRRSPWARSFEARRPAPESWVTGEGAAMFVTRTARPGRVATRSFLWVPVLHGDRVSALLSLQSYEPEAFGDWHVQLLQDVAAHVSLALANAEHFAAAQAERRRLEALHVLELGVAGSADERQIAEAVFSAARGYLDASNLLLGYVDAQGRLTGYGSEHGKPVSALEPKPLERTQFFKKLVETGTAIVQSVPDDLRQPSPGVGWPTDDRRMPAQVIWVPVFHGDRVVAALSAQRLEDRPFSEDDVRLLESAAPVVGIALRTVRLHRANELALAHSVRLQEVAALAGHDLASVVANVADQARNMLDAAGVACWAFDTEGRVTAHSSSGDQLSGRVLAWSGRPADRAWAELPRSVLSGNQRSVTWSLIPLWYGDRLVGALGSIHAAAAIEEPGMTPLDFARHAAIAIESARLVAETRGRIHTLEAVAAFTELDITQPAGTRAEMARLVERALAGSNGALWLLEGTQMARVRPGSGVAERFEVGDAAWLLQALRQAPASRRLRYLLRSVSGSGSEVFANGIVVDGRLAGMLTADAGGSSPSETRRLLSVLAGQAAVVLARLRLVDALDRERQMMDAILRHSPVGIILEDAAGRVVYANPEVEVIYGVAAEEMAGRQVEQILAAAGAMVVSDPDAEPTTGVELHMPGPDRFVQVRRVSIPGVEDEPARVLSLHEDVTQERQVLEAKDLMLRAIGHEVRSPAAAMKTTLAGILQWDELMDPKQRAGLLEEAYEMSDRLLSLVEGQLIIAKLETRRFEPNPVPVVLAKALDQVMAVLRHRYGERTAVVDVRLREDLPSASCEPTHLDQVLTNLIGNALEYTRAPIHVTARARDGWLEVTVADDGPGLPLDRVDTLFQKTGPAGQNRARGGLGLGLYLCRLVVERSFGGRIWLEKTGRSGTTFKFTVPSAQASVRQAAVTASR